MWLRAWVTGVPRLDAARTGDDGKPIGFDGAAFTRTPSGTPMPRRWLIRE